MEELLEEYANRIDQLSSDYGLLRMEDAVETFNRLRSMEARTNEDNRALTEANNKIIMWNQRVNTVIAIYNSLMEMDRSLFISSPERYFIRGIVE